MLALKSTYRGWRDPRDAVIAAKDVEIAHADSEMLMKDRKLVRSEARIG